ncbi:type I polyketide synthase [Actinophytocola algeriensis]|uniref:Acyl transferase domain-containing protein/NAD(P)H-dependent flavin oxidoreductase YrpB (Nitropropane dioxygenase family) n=1 Tax=Actinophytocola algeriensis TaxID=1768010 RepID=A0A7W7Q9A4_9PSEU|nr:type I polyketide synthase [Actinophytocola algeriensis]MBB4909422.1 acyl transferase domain-containing protein/NAD(P)H-dependent flavin oxidoreductase YrpB (nitropropane dioxygenase family) [Actinophytocola algeriensis]MBE1475412.1 acyl transferase domain-containing protein/NAD(P)H-dependent flavin oxidoreductase YrpB (nitropropane dioxygenase family) [Actinophytocola algeriensis]
MLHRENDVTSARGLVIVVNPVHQPSPRLTAAATAAGALGVLELPAGDARRAGELLDRTAAWSPHPFGVRIRPGVTFGELPESAHVVLLADPGRAAAEFPGRTVLAEVGSVAAARAAVAAGAAGLLARGAECGGVTGELGTFVLLQQLLADPGIGVPVWAWGGIGPDTAAAAVVGGAAGVVLDTQFALYADAGLPTAATGALRGLDGSETEVRHGFRVLRRGRGDLPAGQDVGLATSFATRWPSVGAAVRGIRAAVRAAVADQAPADALTTGGPALGTALPVAQGPMTRVSDQPAFAAAVAGEGGLPFLALALSTADQTRDVLTRTRELLGDRPWGVGILGFAAEEIRTAQLDVVRELRPTHAIIAGGRPAQAAALEADGITTYLHVPSPGLLRQFLAAGARRFVFEGAECGGHVGPRNSFPLWQSQLEVVRGHVEEGGTPPAVLFAGGVHDEVSVAMIAAMAAPLVRAGVEVGVLMGTAYLFTEEAVASGAIRPLFQRQVVAAARTDLLETAPGHATRCVHSGFTADFARTAAALRADGVPEREVWERLEQLNIGRLRVASKGIERVGDELRAVGEDRQAAEGMFMAGEVAVLRDRVTTVAALHRSVTEGAAAFFTRRAVQLRDEPAAEPSPEPLRIAIVGMSAMFPGAPDLATYWANVVAGTDSVTEVPAHRWDPSVYFGSGDEAGDRTPSRWGGFLPEIPFDPLSYGIPPASLAHIEPVQLLALEAARRALTDAGYADAAHDRTSVVFGAEAGSDLSNATTLRTVLPGYLGSLPDGLAEQLPELTEDSFPGMLANVIAGRIANRLNLGGANYTVDAACASSLTAVDVACKELTAATSDLVLCGGADLHNGINDYLLFSSVHALSPSGRSATFDAAADGIALGEGVACVVLKRLADAERDGDRIYAVIDGVGSASDGRALGLTAPRPEGQRAALTRAYRNAGVSPAEVGLVEAHGTGTVVGDRTELATLTDVFGAAGASPGSCALGSVKSQIGHTKCAAGLAGLIKAALAVHHGVVPPTRNLTSPNAAWGQDSPFVFHTSASPWVAEPARRIAGVSAFGFGGTNFHVVLRAHAQAPAAHALDEWPAELFTFRGQDDDTARRAAEALLGPAGDGVRLRDLAASASRRSDLAAERGDPVRIAVVASSLAELTALLTRAAAGEHDPAAGLFVRTPVGGGVAFLFPGQGSQRPGMLAELFVAFPELHRHLDARWAGALYPPTAFDADTAAAQQARVTDTAVAQPVLGMVELAAAEVLAGLGIRPDAVAGHSYGELVALTVAGALDPADLPAASAARASAILAAVRDGDPGTMAAVTADEATIGSLLHDLPVVLANLNSPQQTVISGSGAAVAAAVEALRAAGLTARPIPVACAFHSPLVAGAGAVFAETLAGLDVRPPELTVWSNRTAAPYPADVRAELAAQIGAPVRFADQVGAMYDAGIRTFVEVGPGRVLSGLVLATLGDRPHKTVALEERPGLAGLLTAVARLAVAGVDLRTGPLFAGRDVRDPNVVPLPDPPAWTVDGQLVRRVDGAVVPGALQPARRVPELVMSQQSSDALVAEFLRSSRELVAAQRDVLMSYLGGAQVPAPAPVPAPALAPSPVVVPEPVEESVLDTVLAVIAERTGYPAEMIDPQLDLEADLSIDSIKRTEIAGELAARLGLAAGDVESFGAARTAAAIVALLDGPQEEGDGSVVAPERLELVAEEVPATDDALPEDTTVTVLRDGPAVELADALRTAGATVNDTADTVVYLAGDEPLPEAFPLFQQVLARGPKRLLGVQAPGAPTGLRGFFRSVAREYPDTTVTLVETADPATAIVAELAAPTGEPVVLHDKARAVLRLRPVGLGTLGATGAGPAGDGAAEARAAGLGRDSVVLLVGGARGITARFARTLAAAARCRIELVGRTPQPADPTTGTRDELRKAFIDAGMTAPAEIERAVAAALAGQEVAGTIATLEELGSEVRYHCVDVRDAEALRATVKRVHADHGRLDGVVYAAGIIEDKLVADKTVESFRRVFGTKVDGAATLLDTVGTLQEGRPRFAVLFGSIAAALGNRGQSDYAAANDALEALGRRWSTPDRRGLTVHWGPWAAGETNGGMVTPELMRSYVARGIKLIDPDEGPLALLRELAWGAPDTHAVVYTASGW